MKGLWVRLLASHVLVAIIAGVTAYLVVPILTPILFSDEPTGVPAGSKRPEFRQAVRHSLLIGTFLGTAAGMAFGGFATYRLGSSLGAVRRATQQIASGQYEVRVTPPRESELAALAGDVNIMASALNDVESRRVRLLGEVAHELRTPIAIMTGEVEGMLDGVLPTDPERLASLREELHRLERLSEDLAALSRAEAGQVRLNLAEVDVREVVATVVDRSTSVADAAGVLLTMDERAPLIARADPDRIAQVVRNLIANAIRAAAPDGTVHVSLHAGDTVRIVVRDSGTGLSQEELTRIFERFYRGSGSGRSEGSGIGLTISRELMRAHGGDLEAWSPGEGQGATFTAWLPQR